MAAENESEDVVDLLLANGAEINYKNVSQEIALHNACSHNNEKIISLLIRKRADIRALSLDGLTHFRKLTSEKNNYEQSVIAFVKEFSKLTIENISISQQNMNAIQASLIAQEHFEKCLKVLSVYGEHGVFSSDTILQNAEYVQKYLRSSKSYEN